MHLTRVQMKYQIHWDFNYGVHHMVMCQMMAENRGFKPKMVVMPHSAINMSRVSNLTIILLKWMMKVLWVSCLLMMGMHRLLFIQTRLQQPLRFSSQTLIIMCISLR